MSGDEGPWRGRRALVTGHTGFKGAWLGWWLHRLGAEVSGLALGPPSTPSLFDLARLGDIVVDHRADIRDLSAVHAALAAAQPEIVFHLAAQPLVRRSYAEPLETYATNVLGTAHVLEAARHAPSVRAVVVVTTDKCYENDDVSPWPFRERDPLGGHDVYSSSKACAELVTASYRAAFLAPQGRVLVASARAGNVIGGGDWAEDRLIPDMVRAAAAGTAVPLRRPGAVRPWQHVLEPLAGYLMLGQRLLDGDGTAADAWNFGPGPSDDRPVGWVAERLSALWGGRPLIELSPGPHPHEAETLRLDWTKARIHLGWAPRWRLDEALARTAAWYRRVADDPTAVTARRAMDDDLDAYGGLPA
ncbi:MAG: CDP-glucose 4,6-dehydratase [Gemmatimonadales bacterium]|nr:CDP-glucose 4,6-dehydratase [Gemmatimonadales bacterium]